MYESQKEVLVIEDEPESRFILRRVLESAGYMVHEAENVKEALTISEQRIPHVVLVDLTLKNETGMEYVKKHQKRAALEPVPMIMVTATTDKLAILTAVSSGVADYVLKPFEPTILLRKIKKVISKVNQVLPDNIDFDRSKAKLSAKGNLLSISEVGVALEVPVKISGGAQVRIFSPLVSELGCEKTVFIRATKSSGSSRASGQYLNELVAVGQENQVTIKMRAKSRSWK